MKFKEFIAKYRPALEKTINDYLYSKLNEKTDIPLYTSSIQKIIDMVTAGKLIRGILVLLAYESKKNNISKDALTLAAAVELFNTGILISDDIMDDDHMRRGKTTVFYKAIQEGIDIGNKKPRDYGNAIATCISDIALFMAFELIGNIKDISKVQKILYSSSREIQKTGYAQILDVHYGMNSLEPTEMEIYDIYKYKTARYTFSLPLIIGGVLSGYDAKNLKKFEEFGEELGIAFQIKDDEIGIFGDENVIGKPIGSDIRENKKTLLRYLLLKSTDEKTKKKLLRIFGSKKLTEININFVKKSLIESKVLPAIQKIREDKSLTAIKILNTINISKKYKYIFTDMVDFINNRDK